MEDMFNKHYITVDDQGRITDGFSDAFRKPAESDICINERGGYQFRLDSDRTENPMLCEKHGIPLYKYENGRIIMRSMEEIDADLFAMTQQEETPSQLDRVEAQVFYTAMMTDTLL